MAIAYDHISGAEPSTITFKARTVTQTQNSSKMHQELISLADPESSLAIAAVLGVAPVSTAFGLVVRRVGDSTSIIHGDSTVFQGTSPWVVSQVAGSTWNVRAQNSSAADLQATVTPLAGSTWNVRALNSSAGDFLVTISGNSTVAPLAGSTWNTRTLQSSAADLQMTATPAAGSTWNVRALQSSAADLQATVTPVAGSTWNVRALQSSAADLQVTATPAAGSTWTVRALNSSAADLLVTATIGTNLQSTAAPSSNSSGLTVRLVVDNILTTASTTAFASTSFTIQSSAALLRSYVVAYSIMSTNAGPNKVRFYSGSTLLWPVIFAAVSSAVSGANLAVSAPAYLFRTKVAGPLSLNIGGGGSTASQFQVAVSYFRAV